MMPRGWLSITARLSLAFAMVSVTLFTGVAVYLYRALDQQLMQRHMDELATKVVLVRHTLEEIASATDVADAMLRSPNTVSAPDRLHVRLLGVDGQLLFASDLVPIPTEVLGSPAPVAEVPSDFRVWKNATGDRYLVTSAYARLGKPSMQPLLISVALDVREEHDVLLSRFGARLMLAVVSGTTLAALLGWLVAARGLRSVRRIAAAAARITSDRLHKRLDERTAPAELADLVHAFNEMLARLEESFSYLEDFSSDLAHELRTPINNLMGQAEVTLAEARPPKEYQLLLESNMEEYGRLSRMISDMLFIAKVGRYQMPLNREDVNVRSAIEKILAFFDALLEERGIEVALRGELIVSADRILLQRAITNLLSNAVRYTQRGESIGLVIFREGDGRATIEVNNPGPPIPPEHLPRIFDRFYRVDRARSHSYENSGLGLAIVKSIMRLHDGAATVSSVPGDLTRFRLTFP